MYSMGDPRYVYRPWSEERKQAHRERALARLTSEPDDKKRRRQFVTELKQTMARMERRFARGQDDTAEAALLYGRLAQTLALYDHPDRLR